MTKVTETGDKRPISPADSKTTRSSKRSKTDGVSHRPAVSRNTDAERCTDSADDTASDDGPPSTRVEAGAKPNTYDNPLVADRLTTDGTQGDVFEQSTDRPADYGGVGRDVKGTRLSFALPKIALVERVSEKGFRYDGVRNVDNLPFCKIEDYFGTNQSKALRLLRYSASGVGHNMASIFSVNSSDYSRIVLKNNSLSRRVIANVETSMSDRYKIDSTFFVVGRVVHSELMHNAGRTQYFRDLSIQPIHRFLPRMVSSIGSLLDFKRPVFVITHDGINFSTMRKPGENWKTPPARGNVTNNMIHGPSPRPWDEDVPLFDGRSIFQLTNYNTLTRLDQDMDVGDFALVAFTLGGWIDGNVGPLHPKSQRVSLNIQLAILLERPVDNDRFGIGSPLTSDMKCEIPLGVTSTANMKPMEPNELNDEELLAQAHLLSPDFDGLAM